MALRFAQNVSRTEGAITEFIAEHSDLGWRRIRTPRGDETRRPDESGGPEGGPDHGDRGRFMRNGHHLGIISRTGQRSGIVNRCDVTARRWRNWQTLWI